MNQTEVITVIKKIAEKIKNEKDYLTELDAAIGDSDHGINLARGFEEVVNKLSNAPQSDVGDVLKSVGMTLVSTVGGASGPLYGTAFMKAGMKLKGKTEITFSDFLDILDVAIEGIMQRGKAVTGEKTMLDALVPARDAMKASWEKQQDEKSAFESGIKAAKEGVEYTKTIIATKGRASYLGERSIGHQDPGATSASMILETIADNIV